MIQYIRENVKLPITKKRAISQWIKEIAAEYNKKIGDVSFIFCNDEKIIEVNKQYLEHDYFTDIITFDYSEKNTISGDLFISVDTVKSNSEEFGVTFEEEIYRIMIHGILHLCGQDDESEELRNEMTSKENKALEKMSMYLMKD